MRIFPIGVGGGGAKFVNVLHETIAEDVLDKRIKRIEKVREVIKHNNMFNTEEYKVEGSDFDSKDISPVVLKLSLVQDNPIVVDTSIFDLDLAFETNPATGLALFETTNGTGGDREYIIKNIKNLEKYTSNIIKHLEKKVTETSEDVNILIPISFTTAGGTGSALGPYLVSMISRFFKSDKFSDRNIAVLGIALLPAKDGDGLLHLGGTTNCLKEMLSSINDPNIGASYSIVYDISKFNLKADNRRLPLKTKNDLTNEHAAHLIYHYLKDDGDISYGTIDETDKVVGLMKPGLHAFGDWNTSKYGIKDQIGFGSFMVPDKLYEVSKINIVTEEMSDMKIRETFNYNQCDDIKVGWAESKKLIKVGLHGFMGDLSEEFISKLEEISDKMKVRLQYKVRKKTIEEEAVKQRLYGFVDIDDDDDDSMPWS